MVQRRADGRGHGRQPAQHRVHAPRDQVEAGGLVGRQLGVQGEDAAQGLRRRRLGGGEQGGQLTAVGAQVGVRAGVDDADHGRVALQLLEHPVAGGLLAQHRAGRQHGAAAAQQVLGGLGHQVLGGQAPDAERLRHHVHTAGGRERHRVRRQQRGRRDRRLPCRVRRRGQHRTAEAALGGEVQRESEGGVRDAERTRHARQPHRLLRPDGDLQALALLADLGVPRHREGVEAHGGEVDAAHPAGPRRRQPAQIVGVDRFVGQIEQEGGEGAGPAFTGAGHDVDRLAPQAVADQPLLAVEQPVRVEPHFSGEQVAAVFRFGEREGDGAAVPQDARHPLLLLPGAVQVQAGGGDDAEHGAGHDRDVPARRRADQREAAVEGLEGAAPLLRQVVEVEARVAQPLAELLGEGVRLVAGDGGGVTVRVGGVARVAEQLLQRLGGQVGAHLAPAVGAMPAGVSSGTGR